MSNDAKTALIVSAILAVIGLISWFILSLVEDSESDFLKVLSGIGMTGIPFAGVCFFWVFLPMVTS